MTTIQRIKVLQMLVNKVWLTVQDAQIYADRSEASIYRLIRKNRFETNKVDGKTFILRESIDKWQGAEL